MWSDYIKTHPYICNMKIKKHKDKKYPKYLSTYLQEKIREGRQELKVGKGIKLDIDNLWGDTLKVTNQQDSF